MASVDAVAPNVPAEWHRVWSLGQSGIHPTFPLDGRETIYDPYEEYAPTTTVRDYLLVALRAQRRDRVLG
jgi:hypothetical protein